MTLAIACAAGLSSVAAGMETNSVTGVPTIETVLVRSGGKAFRFAPGSTKQLQWNLFSSGQGVHYYRVYFHVVTIGAGEVRVVSLDNSTNAKIGFRLSTARLPRLFNEEDVAQIGSNGSALNTGEYYRLELRVDSTTLAATTVEARLYAAADERTLLWNPSGTIDLTADPNRLTLRNAGDASLDFCATDIVIIEGDAVAPNTWAGEGSIIYLRPSANSGVPQWTRAGTDTGANFSQVNEVTPDDIGTYVTSNTANQVDNYEVADTPAVVKVGDRVNWVAVQARWATSNLTGADPDFVVRMTANGVTEESAAVAGAGSTSFQTGIIGKAQNLPLVMVDMPGASVIPWTKADLDSCKAGIRETVTDTHFIQVSALWVMFEHRPGRGIPPFQNHRFNVWSRR